MQYTTTIALLDGTVTVDSFDNARRFAPDVEALLPRVSLTFDDTIPTDFAALHVVVRVKPQSGETLSKMLKNLSGFVGFPLSREQRVAKFKSCARRLIDSTAGDEVLQRIGALQFEPDVRAIMALVR